MSFTARLSAQWHVMVSANALRGSERAMAKWSGADAFDPQHKRLTDTMNDAAKAQARLEKVLSRADQAGLSAGDRERLAATLESATLLHTGIQKIIDGKQPLDVDGIKGTIANAREVILPAAQHVLSHGLKDKLIVGRAKSQALHGIGDAAKSTEALITTDAKSAKYGKRLDGAIEHTADAAEALSKLGAREYIGFSPKLGAELAKPQGELAKLGGETFRSARDTGTPLANPGAAAVQLGEIGASVKSTVVKEAPAAPKTPDVPPTKK